MKLRRALVLIALLGMGLLIAANLGDLPKFFDALTDVSWVVIPLIVITQLASYYCNALYYKAFFATSGQYVGTRKLFEISLAINFANQAIPAGGVAGTTFLAEATRPQTTSGTATLAQVGRYIFTFVSYFVVLGAGFLMIFLGSANVGQISVRLMLLLMIAILAVGLALALVFSERRRLEKFLEPILRLGETGGSKIVRRRIHILGTPTYQRFLDEFYRALHEITAHKRSIWPLLGWSLGGNITEVATVYGVFIAFGMWTNPGVVITGYTIAIIASVLGIFTAGIGVYEAGMVGAFVALGIPFATAFAIVIVYRVLSLVLFLPPGLYYYRRYLAQPVAAS